MDTLAIKLVTTPVLIGAATLAGRRWGHGLGGWVLALPLTSGPVAYFLAVERGNDFAAAAAVGMLAATISKVLFAAAYRAAAHAGVLVALGAGAAAYAASTMALDAVHMGAVATFASVVAVVLGARAGVRRLPERVVDQRSPAAVSRWDLPVRMATATAVVLGLTAAAPVLGAHLAGLLAPFPVFVLVVALFTHNAHGSRAVAGMLDGLLVAMTTPAVFFLVLALGLPRWGMPAFAAATVSALAVQAATVGKAR